MQGDRRSVEGMRGAPHTPWENSGKVAAFGLGIGGYDEERGGDAGRAAHSSENHS